MPGRQPKVHSIPFHFDRRRADADSSFPKERGKCWGELASFTLIRVTLPLRDEHMSGNSSKPDISLGPCRSHCRDLLPKCRNKQSSIPRARENRAILLHTSMSYLISVITKHPEPNLTLIVHVRPARSSVATASFPVVMAKHICDLCQLRHQRSRSPAILPWGNTQVENWRRDHVCTIISRG